MPRIHLRLNLAFGFLWLVGSGCSSSTEAIVEPPASGLFVETLDPGNGSMIPPGSVIRARLRYRFDQSDSGSVSLMLTCVRDARLVCLDYGTLATVRGVEGAVDVGVAVHAPAGAEVQLSFRLVSEERTDHELIALNYAIAP
jgi:hypothetical protein